MFREQVILQYVQGRKVLDCGGVDHGAFESKAEQGEWLHELICRSASECLGVDILEANVEKINRTGKYKFLSANAEELPFRGEFDVVVAGEMIEHLYNMGKFLDSAWQSLKPNGTLLLTTPNSYSLTGILYAVFRRRELCHPEHTTYYSPQTLRYVVERHGFQVEVMHLLPRKSRVAPIGLMRRWVSRMNPLLAEQIVLVAKKKDRQEKYSDKW